MRDNFAMNRPETQKEKKSVAMAYGRHEEREDGKKTKRRRGEEEKRNTRTEEHKCEHVCRYYRRKEKEKKVLINS